MRVLITDMGDETTAETEVPTIRLAKSGREIPVAWRTGIVGVSKWRLAHSMCGCALARFPGLQ